MKDLKMKEMKDYIDAMRHTIYLCNVDKMRISVLTIVYFLKITKFLIPWIA